VGGCTEPGGDTVTVSPLVHALHHPVTAGLDAGPGGLRQLHLETLVVRRSGRYLSDGERLTAEAHRGLAVLGDHALDLVEVTARERLRRSGPVERVPRGIGGSDAESVFSIGRCVHVS